MIEAVVEIPPSALTEEILRAIIEEFITREGTDYGAYEYSLDEKVEQIFEQLNKQEVVIQFDQRTESVNIVRKNSAVVW